MYLGRNDCITYYYGGTYYHIGDVVMFLALLNFMLSVSMKFKSRPMLVICLSTTKLSMYKKKIVMLEKRLNSS